MTQSKKVAADGGAFIERPPVNPALEPESPKPVERTYKIVGPHIVHETKPGETFKATLPIEQERFLIEVGHIQVVEAEKATPAKNIKE